MGKSILFIKNNGIAILCFLSIFVVAYLLHLFGVVESFQQFVVVLASAAATYIIVCVTIRAQSKHQLEMQQELAMRQSELQKALMENDDNTKRNFEIYNAKLKVYSDFVSKMYDIIADGDITKDEMIDLRSRIFGKVSFYANGDIMESINNELKKVEEFTDVAKMQRAFANIASILQKDLRSDWPVNLKSTYDLWTTFDEIIDNTKLSQDNEVQEAKVLTNNFWHFAMWSAEQQIKALREGVYELNLVEYEEDWRTNLIKQVKKDDLIFLFRSGGWGYMGVYRAVGWRIFEFGENNVCRETLNIFDKGIEEITDQTQIQKDLERSDIYNSRQDGADLCSSIIVEPLAFSSKGIGNPGGVYRRTISRYDHGYGLKQLSRFMAIMDDDSIYNVHFNGEKKVEMGCNKELFKKMLESGNIQPASRDTDGNWK